METIPEPKSRLTREELAEKVEERLRREREVQEVYQTHMHAAAHNFYLAAEAIKNGGHGNATSRHKLAMMNAQAAADCIPKL